MNNERMNAYRREVYLLLADNPAVRLIPAQCGNGWAVDVPAIALSFDESTGLENWDSVLVQVRAAVAAYKAYEAAEKEVNRVSLAAMEV